MAKPESPGGSSSGRGAQNLKLSLKPIRFLRLLKAKERRDGIQCELFRTVLRSDQGLPYEAVSYTWEDGRPPVEITVNGDEIRVTRIVYEALVNLRQEDRDRMMWIDRICTDPTDLDEKAHQLNQLKLVYEYAENVVIYLPPVPYCGSGDVDLLVSMMSQLDTRVLRRSDYMRNLAASWEDEWPRMLFNLADGLQIVLCGGNAASTRVFSVMPSLNMKGSARVQNVLDIMPGHLRRSFWWNECPDLFTLVREVAETTFLIRGKS
ncbi:heterokaryon incompatibility protein-domain-containing protein [Podospora didyma]|uniref:Heterokaryon incompatibility protein-domain-containing protein n=1 Tax=Podospora didyma TaxID=330526 RepID=A0AAE0NNP2_9PEZI|nr:heterokaryon incompatibility protein-domain-containing protein [Podospora didyma]